MRLRGKRSNELLDQAPVRCGETAARRSFYFARVTADALTDSGIRAGCPIAAEQADLERSWGPRSSDRALYESALYQGHEHREYAHHFIHQQSHPLRD